MKYHMIFLLGLMIAGCAAPQPTQAVIPIPPSPPIPTFMATPTATFTPSPVSPPRGEEIVFDESGGKAFTGTAYGEGETAILLANMSSGGEAQWNPFVETVDKQNFTTVTFDYQTTSDAAQDISVVLAKLKERGYQRIICIGASFGVAACNSIVYEPEIVGIVLIAGSLNRNLADVSYPKLFIAGALDRSAFNIEMSYQQAAEPKQLVLFEGNSAHGTSLFSSQDRDQLLSLLTDFVNSLASP